VCQLISTLGVTLSWHDFQVQSAADSRKHDDTGAMKSSLIRLIPCKCLPDPGTDDDPRTPQSYVSGLRAPELNKAWHGFNHALTAPLLCPVDHLATMKADPDELAEAHLPQTIAEPLCSSGPE